MIVIKLDTPINDNGRTIEALMIETPILALHILRANRESLGNTSLFGEIFF